MPGYSLWCGAVRTSAVRQKRFCAAPRENRKSRTVSNEFRKKEKIRTVFVAPSFVSSTRLFLPRSSQGDFKRKNRFVVVRRLVKFFTAPSPINVCSVCQLVAVSEPQY